MNISLFNSLFNTTTSSVNPQSFILSFVIALLLGFISAWVYQFKTVYSKHFVMTLAFLPAIVQIVIFLVNGNMGTGIAVMGAFSLIRFRSAPGGAKEILAIFQSMAIGLATGMGYVLFAIFFTIVLSLFNILFEVSSFGEMKTGLRQLTVTIPENLDYETIFDDIFAEKLDRVELLSLKTSNMGSLFKLKYLVQLKANISEKVFLDELRTRNGNLEVGLTRHFTKENEL